MKTTKEQRGELRLLTDPIREGQWVRGLGDSSIVDARTGETIFEAGPQSSDDPADPSGWIAHLVDAILAIRNTAPDLLDDLDEMQRERDEWKRSAETVATERDHAIRRLQDASDIGKRHAMAEANESASLRVASVIRELRDEIAEKDTAGEKLAQTIACSASASDQCALPAGERCNHHTIAALVKERRTLRLELTAQQAESRALRAQQHVAAGRVRVPLDIPAFPEWDAEIARGNYAASLVDALPEHQIPQPERDAPARVLSALIRR